MNWLKQFPFHEDIRLQTSKFACSRCQRLRRLYDKIICIGYLNTLLRLTSLKFNIGGVRCISKTGQCHGMFDIFLFVRKTLVGPLMNKHGVRVVIDFVRVVNAEPSQHSGSSQE